MLAEEEGQWHRFSPATSCLLSLMTRAEFAGVPYLVPHLDEEVDYVETIAFRSARGARPWQVR
jgi:hypothetical protein